MIHRSPIQHCKNCGAAVVYRVPDDGDTKQRAVCPACHTVHYENPLNVVGTVPHWGDQVLLCKRNIEPQLGKWTLPAGFMELGETTSQGAARETLEAETIRAGALEKALKQARLRFDAGIASHLDVLDVERNLLNAELARIDSERARKAALADMFKALGGGWEAPK